MVARWGLPGESCFSWFRGTNDECAKWVASMEKDWKSMGNVQVVRTAILSEKEAAQVRWRDGTKTFPMDDAYARGIDVWRSKVG